MNNEMLVVNKNAEEWFKECETYLGEICLHQCRTLANLFDRMDYSFYPPNSDNGGVDYYLNRNDCNHCLISNECDQTPRLTSSPYVERIKLASTTHTTSTLYSMPSLYGNRKSENVFLNPKKILIAGKTTREKEFDKN